VGYDIVRYSDIKIKLYADNVNIHGDSAVLLYFMDSINLMNGTSNMGQRMATQYISKLLQLFSIT